MKILPIIENTGRSVKNTSQRIAKASREGYSIGLRTSKIYKQGEASTLFNVGKSVKKQVCKNASIDDLPIIAGAIGMLIPLPLASPILLGLGKITQVIIKSLHKP